MSRDLQTKIFFYPILAVMMLVRKPVFWVAVVLGCGIWWFQKQEEAEAVEDSHALMEETIAQTPMPTPLVEAVATPAIPGVPVKEGDSTEAKEFTFPPDFTEAVLARFRMQEKREATSWKELRTSGVVSNVPAPPAGFKFVFDAEFGLLEMLRE